MALLSEGAPTKVLDIRKYKEEEGEVAVERQLSK
jgi:hypothetical protein